MKTYVLYHANCFDGFCAAWIARGVLKGDVAFVPVQYGQDAPAVEPGSRLYVLDFSYPRAQLWRWWDGPEAVSDLIILDHHKTAQEALAGFDAECESRGLAPPKIVFDMGKSGGRLAWEHFYGRSGIPAPGLVDYTEDRDLWWWKLSRSKEVNAALRSYPLDFALWDGWGQLSAPELAERFVEEGEAIIRRERQIVEDHVKHAADLELDGLSGKAVNATVLFSEIAGELAEGRDFGACYFDSGDGLRRWSLRSRQGGADVSEIAKRRGGGGHRNAAGFEERYRT